MRRPALEKRDLGPHLPGMLPTTVPVIGIDTETRFSASIQSKAKTFMPNGVPRGRTTKLWPRLSVNLSNKSTNL